MPNQIRQRLRLPLHATPKPATKKTIQPAAAPRRSHARVEEPEKLCIAHPKWAGMPSCPEPLSSAKPHLSAEGHAAALARAERLRVAAAIWEEGQNRKEARMRKEENEDGTHAEAPIAARQEEKTDDSGAKEATAACEEERTDDSGAQAATAAAHGESKNDAKEQRTAALLIAAPRRCLNKDSLMIVRMVATFLTDKDCSLLRVASTQQASMHKNRPFCTSSLAICTCKHRMI